MSWIRAALCLCPVLISFASAGGAGPMPNDLRNERIVSYSMALLTAAEAYRIRTGKLLVAVPCTDPRLDVRRPSGLWPLPCSVVQDGEGATVKLITAPNVNVEIRLLRGQTVPGRPTGQ